MAKRIQGITIEIDGSTTKLNDALKDTSLSKQEKKAKIKELKNKRIEDIRAFDLTKPVLLLDEHTAALDPKTAKQVLDTTEKP